MRFARACIILLLLIVSTGAVSAAEDTNDTMEIVQDEEYGIDNVSYTFADLYDEVNKSEDTLDVGHDYTFDNQSDDGAVVIEKSDFTINGNNHVLDGSGQSGIFNITGNNVTINNLVFINGNSTKGGAICSTGQITLNNVTFINNDADSGGAIYSKVQLTLNNATFINNNAGYGGAIAYYITLNCSNSRFIDNSAEMGSSIFSNNAALYVCNSFFTSNKSDKFGQIFASSSTVSIDNSEFINISSTYASALYLFESESSIINSRFVNLTADKTAGAIAIRWSDNTYIKGCEFINTKSFKNAGAVLVDYGKGNYNATIIGCVFNNTSSMIGGTYIQLGGNLFLSDSNFIDNKASCDGGAVYISFTKGEIHNCNFTSNIAGFSSDYIAYGGAIYSDYSALEITGSKFINNSAYQGNAIYACDSGYGITNCIFANNTNAIYTDFDLGSCNLENNTYNNDSVVTNQTFPYQRFIDTPALNLTLINNTVNVTGIPSQFDLRDWGLVTPVKDQGMMGACWAFAMINAVESALLKAYGIEFDLSEGNLFHNMLRYSIYGNSEVYEGGISSTAVSYLLGWYGPVLGEDDVFDEVGKLSPFMQTGYDVVHIQDAIIVPNDEVPEGSKIKTAILNYGALSVNLFYGADVDGYYNPNNSAQYINESLGIDHSVSIIGWNDNFSKDNFLITPPGDGAWICKNSWGTECDDNGILYVSYYDKTFLIGELMDCNAFGIVIENTIPYNKNYQHDFIWEGIFLDMVYLRGINGSISYANQFESAGDDLIAAVGTYFNETGVNYTVEIYVNDELKLTQDGVSPFCGYHTIKLNEYIPVKTGEVFRAVITSNAMPYCYCPESRVHYIENVSFFYYGGEWVDLYAVENIIACLKVYTVEDREHIINYTFRDLTRHINGSGDVLEIIHDYTFDNQSDDGEVVIEKSNFTINGNGHVLDGNGQSRIFKITGNNVTINNLILINGNSRYGAAIYVTGEITVNNVTFINNTANDGAAIANNRGIVNCNNSRFIDNPAESGASIYSDNGEINVYNTFFTSSMRGKYGQIRAFDSAVNIENSDFVNLSSDYAPALSFDSCEISIINSRFVNLTANITAGAISVKRSGNLYVKGCNFINTKSFKNAGAVHVDYGTKAFNSTIIGCVFSNASSMFGGAYIQLGGNLILNDTNFTNNNAIYDGGAVFLSFANAWISNCAFDSNWEKLLDDYSTCGGAICCDMSNLKLANSRFTNNSALFGGAIYAYDSCYDITGCLFADNANAIFTDFDRGSCNLNNNEYNNDSVITNQSYYYQTFMVSHAVNLTLLNNTINVAAPPSRFDLRDWGWITPVKSQGDMGACWAFSTAEALQTALLKAAGIRYDVSENNIQKLQIRYSPIGSYLSDEGGYMLWALGNVLSWYGAVVEEEDVYDEVGKLSLYIGCENKIYLQDAYFIMPDSTDYVGDVKKAILNYGAVSIEYAYSYDEPYFNINTSAQYTNESLTGNHEVAVIGWDDNYSADNFLIAPPGDGAWICKNSWGTDWGDEGYFYMSYYEKSLFMLDPDTNVTHPFIACIFNNAIDYHLNYQTDLNGLYDFNGNYTQYSNEFTAYCDDLIAGVGTYFNQSGIDYSFDVYVNNKLVYSQSGVSEFAGYRTIVLDKYVTIKANDTFKVVFKNNALPYEDHSRQHYVHGMSFVKDGEEWKDITLENKTVCLKVYTVGDDSKIINNKDITVDYDGGKYFAVNVVTADGRAVVGAKVTFKINGKTTTVSTGSDGVAKIKITDVPKKYTVTTSYNSKAYKNTVTVKQVLTASKVTVKKTAKKFTLKAKLKINGKLVKGKVIKFKLNGKTYKVKTNAKGIAQKTLKKSIIKKLKKGKTYTVKVTYLKDTIKTTVKVK